jgi:hypothetical protein
VEIEDAGRVSLGAMHVAARGATIAAALVLAGSLGAEAPPEAKLDLSKIPPGRHWYCVPPGVKSPDLGSAGGAPAPPPAWCRRDRRDCEIHDEEDTWSCVRRDRAWCFTFDGAAHSGQLTVRYSCARSRESCAADRAALLASPSPNVTYANVSACTAVP